MSCIRAYVNTGASDCELQIETFLQMVSDLQDLYSQNEPAAAVIKVLRDAPEVGRQR